MADQYLLLWLEAPLQAWGHDSKFGRRDSLDFPTKSGVLGLLCCARGAGGEEVDWLSQWADLDMSVDAFVPNDQKGQPMIRQPLLMDFQMVGSGYDDQDPWQNLLIPKTREGKKPNGTGTKMTYRYYLQDMAFAVVLEMPDANCHEVIDALKNPVWDLYLGRKNCVPTELIYQGVFSSAEQANQAAQIIAENKSKSLIFRILQGEHEGNVFTLNDVPLQFGSHKKYRDRRVTLQRLY
jgi:CRISPR system Cascade subunit CasD